MSTEFHTRPLIHIVDDDDSMRVALIDLLKNIGFDAIGYGSTGEFLLNSLPDQHGCILLDIQLPGPSGLDLQAALLRKSVALPIIFLTGHADVSSSVRAMKAGAIDFLEKPVARQTLLEALERALASDIARRATVDAARRHQERLDLLTPREQAVFERVISGMLNKQIALDLGISLRTVKAHRAEMMRKLGASTPAELGRIAGKSAESDER
jgi:FixJ family two-component response regulator